MWPLNYFVEYILLHIQQFLDILKGNQKNLFKLRISMIRCCPISKTSVVQTSLGPWKFIQEMGTSNHRGLIMAPCQEANSDNLGSLFELLYNNGMLCVLLRIASSRQF